PLALSKAAQGALAAGGLLVTLLLGALVLHKVQRQEPIAVAPLPPPAARVEPPAPPPEVPDAGAASPEHAQPLPDDDEGDLDDLREGDRADPTRPSHRASPLPPGFGAKKRALVGR